MFFNSYASCFCAVGLSCERVKTSQSHLEEDIFFSPKELEIAEATV